MHLGHVSETFGLSELKTGFFPHLFNNDDQQDNVGNLPYWCDQLTRRSLRFSPRTPRLLQVRPPNPQTGVFHDQAGLQWEGCWLGARRVDQFRLAIQWLVWENHLLSACSHPSIPHRQALWRRRFQLPYKHRLRIRRFTLAWLPHLLPAMLRTAPATSRLHHGYVFIMSKETRGTLRLQGYLWQIHLGMRMGTLPSRLAYNPNLPAMASDPETSRSKGRLLYARKTNQESIPGNAF